MTQRNDGGPAFPVPGLSQLPSDQFLYPLHGMSLRDAAALAALKGLCANPVGPFQANDRSGWGLTNCQVEDVIDAALHLADAFIAARERT